MQLAAVHGDRWWCPYDRDWMSATLNEDTEGEQYVECLNCRRVLVRLRPPLPVAI